jgi:3-oxoacyl-[acyl-carrier-protein] synthase II
VPRVDGKGGGLGDPHAFDADKTLSQKEQRRIEDFILVAIAAADEAVEDSGWKPANDEEKNRTGVLIGSGIGGIEAIGRNATLLEKEGPRKISPFFIPSALINLASGQVSIRHGFRGPNHSVVTACATGAHAVGDAARLIVHGDADVMVAGGAEAAVCRLAMAGFAALRALSTNFNDTPEKASRPYDKDRDGFVMGEGAGCVMLEEYEHAKARGAKIYAEVKGYGLSGDAYHITAPAEDGDGGFRAMTMALKDAGLSPGDIDHLDAARGRDRAEGGRASVRQFGGELEFVVDQVSDRAFVGRGRGGGDHLLRAGDPRPDRAADAEFGQSVSRDRHRFDAA